MISGSAVCGLFYVKFMNVFPPSHST